MFFFPIKTLNSRKQIFGQEYESTSFVKINLRKMQFEGDVILSFYLIYLVNNYYHY